MYHSNYTSPLTVWYHACKYAITQIKWCLLYFHDEGGNASSPSKKKKEDEGISDYIPSYVKYATRLCEFFAIDQGEDFLIWNFTKSIHKPAHVIHFNEKHTSDTNSKLYRIR